jgi:hypothetical protein
MYLPGDDTLLGVAVGPGASPAEGGDHHQVREEEDTPLLPGHVITPVNIPHTDISSTSPIAIRVKLSKFLSVFKVFKNLGLKHSPKITKIMIIHLLHRILHFLLLY